MNIRARKLTGAAVAVGLSLFRLCASASATPITSGQQGLPGAAMQRQLVTVLIREAGGSQLGSGVLVGSAAGGYWVATNRHVVQEHNTVCVVTADRKAAGGLVWPMAKVQPSDTLDLALIWLPHRSKDSLVVASLRQPHADSGQLPLVIATGFPTSLQPRLDGPPYTETHGLLLPLLRSPLKGGFDLSYTAELEKGMSGGGVFDGVELIGINGAHANPLWPGEWNGQDGKAIDDVLQQKLEMVSLGISANEIVKLLKAAAAATFEIQSKSVETMACDAKRYQN